MNGKIMASLTAKAQNQTLITNSWANSIYFYHIKDKSGKIVTGKIVKLE